MAADDVVIDQWSGFNHKAGMVEAGGDFDTAPPFIGSDEPTRRRLNAYSRAEAYLECSAREFIDFEKSNLIDEDALDDHREYGDAAAIVSRIAGGVTGSGMEIVVPGADAPFPVAPVVPKMPEEPADGDQAAKLVYDAQLQIREQEVADATAAWLELFQTKRLLEARQKWLRQWAEEEGFEAKIHEAETDHIIPLGDGVYVLSWNAPKRRVSVDVYQPKVYFPVLTEQDRGFPSKVHLAWLYTNPEDGEEYLRRITYELIDAAFTPTYAEEPATKTCVVTDASYMTRDLGEETVFTLEGEGATYAEMAIGDGSQTVRVQQFDLMIDFIPIVHVPNTPSSSRHFGRSSLARIAQLLDDIAKDDTDLQRAAALAGFPAVGVSGAALSEDGLEIGPGKVIGLGERGRFSQLDMASSIEALQKLADSGRNLLSVNSQVPAGLIGRVDPSKVTSGLVLALSFTPFQQLIEVLRMVRTPKYKLILKMVQRLALVNEDEHMKSDSVIRPAEMNFGSYMPQDLPGMVQVVVELLREHGISTNTGLRMLAEAGVPIEDIDEELAQIRAEDGQRAGDITAATENPRYGAAFLGIDNWQPADDAVDPDAGAGPAPVAGAPAGGPPTVSVG